VRREGGVGVARQVAAAEGEEAPDVERIARAAVADRDEQWCA
jgi:hypothetical protein